MMKLEFDTLIAETVRMRELVDMVSTHTTSTDDLLERLRKQLESGGYPNTAGHQEATAAGGYENLLEGLRKMQQDASQTTGILCCLESSWKTLEEACSRSRVMYLNRLQLLRKIEEDISNSINSCLESKTRGVENPCEPLSTVSEGVNNDQNHMQEQSRYQDPQDDVENPAKSSSAVLEGDQNDMQQGSDEDPSQDVEKPPESASVVPDFVSNDHNQEGRSQVPQDDIEKLDESSTLVKGVCRNQNDMKGEGKKEDAPQDLENPMQKVDEEKKVDQNIQQKPQNILETWREVAAVYNRREDRYLLGEYFGHAKVKKRTRKAKR